jgi:uncharacterized membrane protein
VSGSSNEAGADGHSTLVPEVIRFVVVPNHSLSAHGAIGLVAVFAVVGLLISVYFVILGAWPVAPFAGAELVLVAAIFYRMQKRARDGDLLEIDDRYVTIRRRRGGSERTTRFLRHWSRVRLEQPASRLERTRLTIGSQGRVEEVGSCITDAERASLAARLRQVLGH